MLRDVLSRLPGFGTWPCDEINYIWRHGNIRHPTDELAAGQATPAAQRFIRKAFHSLARQQDIVHVVEKTCANCLRVPFVHQVVPEAKYLFIVRDGRDATASAMRRWTASLDLGYILRKARYVPLADAPYYALRYAGNRVHRLLSSEKRLATWGPRFSGMQDILREQGLEAVCASQWARCVESASRDLAQLDSEQVLHIRYEELVENPVQGLRQITDFLGVDLPERELTASVEGVTARNIGKWRQNLSASQLEQVEPILLPLLTTHGYV